MKDLVVAPWTKDRFGNDKIVFQNFVRPTPPDALETILRRQIESNTENAIFVHAEVPVALGYSVEAFTKLGFKFHHMEEATEKGPAVQVWYKWCNTAGLKDRVPPHMTSTAGVGAVVFSPDCSAVLLVKEYGKYKLVTGVVEMNETNVQALYRELLEEVNVEVDPTVEVRMVGGWQMANAKGTGINDTFTVFSVRAKSWAFKADKVEIHEAAWFPVNILLMKPEEVFYLPRTVTSERGIGDAVTPSWSNFPVSDTALLWLGRCLDVYPGNGGFRVRIPTTQSKVENQGKTVIYY